MGLYLEPECDKRQYLEDNGVNVYRGIGKVNIDFNSISTDSIIVCNVNNGHFWASAIAFDENEFNIFNTPDGRYKEWYIINKEVAKSVAPQWETYIRG